MILLLPRSRMAETHSWRGSGAAESPAPRAASYPVTFNSIRHGFGERLFDAGCRVHSLFRLYLTKRHLNRLVPSVQHYSHPRVTHCGIDPGNDPVDGHLVAFFQRCW